MRLRMIGLVAALALGAGGTAFWVARSSVDQSTSPSLGASTISDPQPRGSDYRRSDSPYSLDSIRERNRTARTMGDFFDGVIAGIRVDRNHTLGCADESPMTESDLKRYRIPIPRDLPAEVKVNDPEGWMCGTRPRSVTRIISFDNFMSFGVARLYNEDTIKARAGERLVSKGIIQGRPAVLIKPLSRQGSGNSWIAFKDGDDLIVLLGVDVRFNILRRAAESLPL